MDCVLEQQRRRLLRQDRKEAGGVSRPFQEAGRACEASVWALSLEQWAATGGRGGLRASEDSRRRRESVGGVQLSLWSVTSGLQVAASFETEGCL